MPPIAQPLCGAVLVVSPQAESCKKVETTLSQRGHIVTWCTDAVDALHHSAQQQFDLILVDPCLQDVSTVDLAGQIKARGRKEEIVVASFNGNGSIGHAKPHLTELCLANPIQHDDLVRSVDAALARSFQLRGIVSDKLGSEDDPPNGNAQSASYTRTRLPMTTALVGRSPIMKQLFRTIQRIAPIGSNVLITGATGTGKELVARAIHDRSARRDQPFVDVNSSAIPDTLFETEFFGHQRGTFTGALPTVCWK